MKKDYLSIYLSISAEPVLHADKCRETVQAESGKLDESSMPELIRDSVLSEPGYASESGAYRQWLDDAKKNSYAAVIIVVTFAAGILGGLAAVPGVFLAGSQSFSQLIYLVCFGPVIEEFMKQGAMIFLLEKKPYLVRYGWQFFLVAMLASLTFAGIENIIYQNVYLRHLDPTGLELSMAFRWQACVTLHFSCAIIVALGLRRAWHKHLQLGRPVELSDAYGFFATAIIVHGIYNLLCAIGIIDPLISLPILKS